MSETTTVTTATRHEAPAPGGHVATSESHEPARATRDRAESRLGLYMWLGGVLVVATLATIVVGALGGLDVIYTDGEGLMSPDEAMASTIFTVGLIVLVTAVVLFTLRSVILAMRTQETDLSGIRRELSELERTLDGHAHDAGMHGAVAGAGANLSDAALASVRQQVQGLHERVQGLQDALRNKADSHATAEHQRGTNDAIERLNMAVVGLQKDGGGANAEAMQRDLAELESRLQAAEAQAAEAQHRAQALEGDLAHAQDALASHDARTDRDVEELNRRISGFASGTDEATVLRLIGKERDATLSDVESMVQEAVDAADANRRRVGIVTSRIRARSKVYVVMGVVFLVLIVGSLILAQLLDKTPGLFQLQAYYWSTGLIMAILVVALASLMFALADALRIIRKEFV